MTKSQSVIQVGQVFRTDTIPGIFHVERKQDPKLDDIQFELEQSTRILHIYGPTKSGKTHFTRVALKAQNPVLLSCIEASSSEQLWEILAADLGISIEKIVKQVAGENVEGKGNFSFGMFGAKIGGGTHSSMDATEKIAVSISRECAKCMTGRALIIDDFQWLSSAEQSKAIRQLRPFLDKGIRVVLISVYDRADRDDAVGNAEGRVRPLPFPRWTPSDIEQIAVGGFGLLNCKLDPAVVEAMRKLSNRNPLLMTEICLEICKRKGIRQSRPSLESVPIAASDLEGAIKAIAESQKWLLTGFLQVGDTKPYLLKESKERVNLRTLLLLALRVQDPNQGIGIDALQKRMQRLLALGFSPPAPAQLQAQITKYITESQSKPKSSWFLDYSRSKKMVGLEVVDATLVHIVNPYFRTVVEWYLAPLAGLEKRIEIGTPPLKAIA